ncbi:hypothetical protein LguiB_025874 [Lonicera macranthoides]
MENFWSAVMSPWPWVWFGSGSCFGSGTSGVSMVAICTSIFSVSSPDACIAKSMEESSSNGRISEGRMLSLLIIIMIVFVFFFYY